MVLLEIFILNPRMLNALTEKEAMDILGISNNPTEDEIKRAYWKKAQQVHPDKLTKDASPDVKKKQNDLFLKLKDAYDLLNKSNKTEDVDIFVRKYGLFVYSKRDIAFLKDYYHNVNGNLSNMPNLLKLRFNTIEAIPKLKSKIDEILVSTIKQNKSTNELEKVYDSMLKELNFDESFLTELIQLDFLNSNPTQMQLLKKIILKHFLGIKRTQNMNQLFWQFSLAIMTPNNSIKYWRMYADLRGNPEFSSLLAEFLVEGDEKLVEENLSTLYSMISYCNGRSRLSIYLTLLEKHPNLLEKNLKLAQLLAEVNDFSKFNLFSFDNLIYSRSSGPRRRFARILLNKFLKNNPAHFVSELNELKESCLSKESLKQFSKNYSYYIKRLNRLLPKANINGCEKFFKHEFIQN